MKFKALTRSAQSLTLLTLLISVGLAQKPAEQLTPNADRLRETVAYLASDALEGRRTGTRGANDAAHYIAGEFQRLGLKPGSPVARGTRLKGAVLARYQQAFPYVAGVELAKKELLFGIKLLPKSSAQDSQEGPYIDFRIGEDWMPLGFSTDGWRKQNAAVFAGYGITAAELNFDDYARVNARDQVAIIFSGTPDGDNPHGQFAKFEDARWKAIAARSAGATALVIIAHEPNFKDDRLSRLHYDNSAGNAGLPVVAISRATAARIFQTDLAGLDAIEKKTAAATKGAGDRPQLPGEPRLGINLSVELIRNEVSATNVIGILEGSDPELKNEAIVLGAHYDHLGHGGEGSLAPRSGEIHHGADDNASGVAGLLELARLYSSQQPRPKRTLVFIAFSGEEEGLLGSNYYVNHPVLPLANVAAMINMDMIGRMKDKKLNVGGVGTAKEWPLLVSKNNGNVGVTRVVNASTGPPIFPPAANEPRPTPIFQLTLNQDGYGPSDHSSFYSKRVPVLFFFTGSHEDYHKPSDTAEKINYADEALVLKMIIGIIDDLDLNKRPTYTVAKSDATGRASGFRVYLGTIPNYADANDGLLLDGVRDDSPAAKAGLQAGDKIVKLAGRDIRNVYDYTYALGEMKAGEEYEVEVMRAGARVKLKLTPAARK